MSDYAYGFSQAECYFLIHALVKHAGGKVRIKPETLKQVTPVSTLTWWINPNTKELCIDARSAGDWELWVPTDYYANEKTTNERTP